MSSRTSRQAVKPPTSRSRKVVSTFLILSTLFLLGATVVLSATSYYLKISLSAYLTEDEVAWHPSDGIKPLKYNPNGTSQVHQRRQGWEDVTVDPNGGVMGTGTLPEIWEGFEEVATSSEGYDDAVETLAEDHEDVWDVDGPGSGAYWMRKDWNGTVQQTDSWERLRNVTTRPGVKIPRLIHQTWKDEHLPEKWRKAWKECREGMPDYEYMLWTDELSRKFVETHYPSFLHMFDSYKYPIQRADSIRYFILNDFGGVYMDLDIGCRRRLDSLLQGDWEVVLPITKPVGVSNDLIFSSKRSAFMENTVRALPAFNHEWFINYPTVMFSTGPMFLSAQYAVYASAHPLTETHPRGEVRILPKSLYGKNADQHTVPHSFFSHFYGSSWHDEDAGFITFLGDWGKKLMYVGAVVIVLGVVRLAYTRWKGGSSQQYQLLSLLPISASSGGTHSGSTTPTSSSGSSPTFEQLTIPAHVSSDLASAFRRAGNVILAAPATFLASDRRGGRRRTGLLYFVPALFLPGPSKRRRPRTASEASQLPLWRPRGDRDRGPSPPPYDASGLPRPPGDEAMDEVDAFLRDTDETGSSTTGSSEATVNEAAWAEWGKDGQH